MEGVSGAVRWGAGTMSRAPAPLSHPRCSEAVDESLEKKGLGEVVTELSSGNPVLGSCLLLPSERLGIWEGVGHLGGCWASQQAPKARPGGMSFWLSHMVVPRVGKASKRSFLSSLASGLPLPCVLALP